MGDLFQEGLVVTLRFLKPTGMRVGVQLNGGPIEARLQVRSEADPGGTEWRNAELPGLAAAAGRMLEVRVPFEGLGVRASDPVAFFVILSAEATELEHHPRHQPIEFEVPDRRFAARNWTA
jgi:hypothetical protein